jgi:gas vesicle protein
MKNSSSGFGLFLLGSAVGAALGILLAPDAGDQTRSVLADKAKDTWEQFKDKISEGEDTLDQYKQEAEAATNDVAEKAKSEVKQTADGLNDKIQNT